MRHSESRGSIVDAPFGIDWAGLGILESSVRIHVWGQERHDGGSVFLEPSQVGVKMLAVTAVVVG